MSGVDFMARGIAARLRTSSRRLAVLDTLANSIAAGLSKGLPAVSAAPPVISAAAVSSAISGGKNFGFNYNSTASDYRHHYAFKGGTWEHRGSTGGNAFSMSSFGSTHYGNGSNPAANPVLHSGLVIRFITHAPEFEINSATDSGFRVLVNGEYVTQGMLGNYEDLGVAVGQNRFIKFAFPSAGEKRVEIQFNAPVIYFRGIVVPPTFDVQPWELPDRLKMTLWSDSLAGTVSESGSSAASIRAALHGQSTSILQMLTGQPDIWPNSSGGTGWFADASGTKSDALERAPLDVVPYGFDVLWSIMGRNDDGQPAGVIQQRVTSFIQLCLSSNPDMILIMTGPMPAGSANGYATDSSMAAVQDGMRAACAAFPGNCAFLETLGHTGIDDPWIFGTGKQGSAANNGNADRIIGPDGVHWTIAGHAEVMLRLVRETAKALPLLRSRIANGVIPGSNDLDIA